MIDHELDYVDVAKVDIESFEYELFATAWLVLQEQRIGALVVEIHPKLLTSRGVDLAYARQVVEDCGYQWQEVGHELILLQPQRGAE
jgi:hypothetical protein